MPILSNKRQLKRLNRAKKGFRKSEKRSLAIAKSILNYKSYNRIQRMLGPGIVTGAADDDPSGIITYSQTGAVYGYSLLWTALFMYPMLLYVQEACSRIGAVTGKGLAAVLRDGRCLSRYCGDLLCYRPCNTARAERERLNSLAAAG